MSKIKEFTINISQDKLDDLSLRLQQTRWPEKETPNDWSQGTPLSYMKEVCDYWCNEYDWKKEESTLNEFPQFITEIIYI